MKSEPEELIDKTKVLFMANQMIDVIENSGYVEYCPLSWLGTEEEHTSKLMVNPKRICCLISLLYLFGKRISENLKLKRKNLWTKRGYLYVKFPILKRKRQLKGELRRLKKTYAAKRVSIKNTKPFSTFVIMWANTIPHPESWLFPGNSRPHVQVVRRKNEEGKVVKTYKYFHSDEGRMSRTTAYRILKSLNPEFFPHYFRKSLATHLAEDPKVGPLALTQWFDWEKFQTAISYINRTQRMTQRIQDRVPI